MNRMAEIIAMSNAGGTPMVFFPTKLSWCDSYDFVGMWKNKLPLESLKPPEDPDDRYDLTIIFPRVMNLLTVHSKSNHIEQQTKLFIDRYILKCNKGKA